ncbi:peroxidase superfamily protein [Wolffia australiana]
MASTHNRSIACWLLTIILCACTDAQLSLSFYDASCPSLQIIVKGVMVASTLTDPRVPARIVRLFFHDCFVNGCDASVLLADTPTFTGEQNAAPNKNSLAAFDIIDRIKFAVELVCKSTVSCADILTIAARDAVVLSGGPSWQVLVGRRDARTASQSAAESDLPSQFSGLSTLVTNFANKGLNLRDLVALSGAHTFGVARCASFRDRAYNDQNIDPLFAAILRALCPPSGGLIDIAPLDVKTPTIFDNSYYLNLVSKKGLLHSDQELFNGGPADSIVSSYAADRSIFFRDFADAMVKMGNISPLTGSSGEIRQVCSRVN